MRNLFLITGLLLALASNASGSEPPLSVPYEHPAQDNVYYFVLTDRFADGNPGNNSIGGGFDPADPHAYHGGDFSGLAGQLDYLQALGVNAIWMTPVFQNQAVQGSTSAYHGYWITDFVNSDQHLGTNEEFRALVNSAHARNMRIFLDIVTNHTADVNVYTGDENYIPKSLVPYKDSSGTAFDDRDYAWSGSGTAWFPELDSSVSFPKSAYIPVGKETLRNPAWLNDITNYHNRGASSFSGENSLYGDFFGLDDLFTEKPDVVQGMIEAYSHWITEFGVDGFRIDTVKHVNQEFWQAFVPAIRETAISSGIDHFFQFGEVFSFDPPFLSEFSTTLPLDATLDFAFAGELRAFAYQGISSANLNYLFSRDDLLTDADSHANARPLFVGNHDIGRAAAFVRADNPGASEAEILARLELAEAIKFFTRGQPVIYYGDEQGFAGSGNSDAYCREDMLPSSVPVYNNFDLVGTDSTTAEANFDQTHPLFQSIAAMAQVYHTHPALRRGAHIPRTTDSTRVLAVSRIHRSDLIEYLFIGSNHESGTESIIVPTSQTNGASFTRIASSSLDGAPTTLATDNQGVVSLEINALTWAVYKADQPLPQTSATPAVTIELPRTGDILTPQGYSQDGITFPGRVEVSATTDILDYAEITFSYQRSDKPDTWYLLGVDTAAPYRVFFRPPDDLPDGVELSFAAAVNDARGKTATSQVNNVTLSGSAPVTVLIDFGSVDSWRGASVPSPDPNGNFWNSVSVGNYWTNLVDTSNRATSIAFGPGAHGTDSYNGPAGATSNPVSASDIDRVDIDPTALGILGVNEAVFDYHTGVLGKDQGYFSVNGLDASSTYTITLFGSHKYVTDSTTRINIYSDQDRFNLLATADFIVGDGAAHNRDRLVTFEDLIPGPTGGLHFEFGGADGTSPGYLNCMAIRTGRNGSDSYEVSFWSDVQADAFGAKNTGIGFLNDAGWPYVYHFELGQWLVVFPEISQGPDAFYAYVPAWNRWIWSSNLIYGYFYDFSMSQWMAY